MRSAEVPSLLLKSNIAVPQLGLGTYQLKGEDCVNAVRNAVMLGYTHFDTADYYKNHWDIATALKGEDRKRLFITSKIWSSDLKYDDVMRTFDRMLKELKMQYIDLLLVHWPNDRIPIKETMDAFGKLLSQKRIRAAGVSNFKISKLKEALDDAEIPICVDQVEFHVLLNQRELLKFCDDNDIRITAYCPIARGLVNEQKQIIEMAKKFGKSPSQVSLRWLIQKGIIAIPKSKSIEHLKENMDIFDFELSEKDMAEIDGMKIRRRLVDTGIFD